MNFLQARQNLHLLIDDPVNNFLAKANFIGEVDQGKARNQHHRARHEC